VIINRATAGVVGSDIESPQLGELSRWRCNVVSINDDVGSGFAAGKYQTANVPEARSGTHGHRDDGIGARSGNKCAQQRLHGRSGG